MIHHVFAVYDSKLKAFFPPFLAATQAVGIRMFATGANDENTQLHHHAEDFTLFEIATWDDETAVYLPFSPHINHGLAAKYRMRDDHEKPQRHDAPVLSGPEGGDPALKLRQVPRP